MTIIIHRTARTGNLLSSLTLTSLRSQGGQGLKTNLKRMIRIYTYTAIGGHETSTGRQCPALISPPESTRVQAFSSQEAESTIGLGEPGAKAPKGTWSQSRDTPRCLTEPWPTPCSSHFIALWTAVQLPHHLARKRQAMTMATTKDNPRIFLQVVA